MLINDYYNNVGLCGRVLIRFLACAKISAKQLSLTMCNVLCSYQFIVILLPAHFTLCQCGPSLITTERPPVPCLVPSKTVM